MDMEDTCTAPELRRTFDAPTVVKKVPLRNASLPKEKNSKSLFPAFLATSHDHVTLNPPMRHGPGRLYSGTQWYEKGALQARLADSSPRRVEMHGARRHQHLLLSV